jgi:very-short-patch-repair endonuclease
MANARARQLRQRPAIGETRLCKELRQLRRQGYHFRRQAPIDRYIVDFACLAQRVVIEVDGVQHQEPEALAADGARDADLSWRGFKVLRFRNDEVRDSMHGVMLEVLAALGAIEKPGVEPKGMTALHPPTPSPSPQGKGGSVGICRSGRSSQPWLP